MLEALENQRYKPNEIARSLRHRVAKTIVVEVPDIANSFYASVIKGAQAVCGEGGYSLIVCNTDENKDMEQQIIARTVYESANCGSHTGIGSSSAN